MGISSKKIAGLEGEKYNSFPKAPPICRGEEMTGEDQDRCEEFAAQSNPGADPWEAHISWIRAYGQKAQELGYILKSGVWVKERKGFTLRF